jgi:hypothetical protein
MKNSFACLVGLFLMIANTVQASTNVCKIQIKLTSEGEDIYNIDPSDPEKKFIKAAFTEHIQSILEGVENAGLVIEESTSDVLSIQLNYLRSPDSLIRGLQLKMDGIFSNKYDDISIIKFSSEKKLK